MKEMIMTWQQWLDQYKKELRSKGWEFPNRFFDDACMRALAGITKLESAPAGIPLVPPVHPTHQTPNPPVCAHLS